jgi:hypothetical protein
MNVRTYHGASYRPDGMAMICAGRRCGRLRSRQNSAALRFPLTSIAPTNVRAKKKIVSRQPFFINLKSNTMKNTLQMYVLSNRCAIDNAINISCFNIICHFPLFEQTKAARKAVIAISFLQTK